MLLALMTFDDIPPTRMCLGDSLFDILARIFVCFLPSATKFVQAIGTEP